MCESLLKPTNGPCPLVEIQPGFPRHFYPMTDVNSLCLCSHLQVRHWDIATFHKKNKNYQNSPHALSSPLPILYPPTFPKGKGLVHDSLKSCCLFRKVRQHTHQHSQWLQQSLNIDKIICFSPQSRFEISCIVEEADVTSALNSSCDGNCVGRTSAQASTPFPLCKETGSKQWLLCALRTAQWRSGTFRMSMGC